jgi:hypothetical protein
MLKFDHLTAAQDLVRHANSDHDRLLVQLLTTMTERIVRLEQQVNEFGQWRNNADTTAIRLNELEAGLGKLTDLTAGGLLDPFDERVLQVLDVRSGTAFEHLEADIDEKLSDFIDSYSFTEAVAEAVEGSIGEQVKQKLDDILHDAIIDAIGDAEDIVRKGLRSIL